MDNYCIRKRELKILSLRIFGKLAGMKLNSDNRVKGLEYKTMLNIILRKKTSCDPDPLQIHIVR
jgi:hypothetical protein